MATPDIERDDDTGQTIVIQNDLIRYLFSDDPGDGWDDVIVEA